MTQPSATSFHLLADDRRATAAWCAIAGFACVVALMPGGFVPLLAAGVLLAVAGALWLPAYPEVALGALLATSALDVMGRLAKVGPATVTAYQAVLGLTLLFVVGLVLTGRAKLSASGIDGWLALMLAAALTVVPAAVNGPASAVAFVSLASSVVLVYLVMLLAPTPEQLYRVLVALAVVAAGLGVLAVAERVGIFSVQEVYKTTADGIRARVFFKDPNIFGGVLAAAAITAVPLALGEKRWLRATALWALVGAAVLGVVATLSRGAFLGLVVGGVLAVILSPVRTRTKIALLGAGAGLLAVFVVVVLDPRWVADKVLGIGDESSALNRVYLAQAAMAMFADNPIGIGPGMWKEIIPAYRPYDLPADLLESHTTYFTLLVEVGILGLIGFVGALAATGLRLVRALLVPASPHLVRVLLAATASGAAVLLVQSVTYSMETSKFLWFLIGASLTAASFTSSKESA
ncbi:MAG: O-antigen ligase family protein [Coriobacteriia bacterium]|nr:O-antigen ligase family protein [Coriobacteriia bacterium]